MTAALGHEYDGFGICFHCEDCEDPECCEPRPCRSSVPLAHKNPRAI